MFALFSLLSSAITIIFSPIIVLFVGSDGRLKFPFQWCGQVDNTMDGDIYWNDKISHPFVNTLPRYLKRILWLCRNPAQVLDNYMSVSIGADEKLKVYGNPLVSDQPKFVPGYCFATVAGFWVLYVCFPTFPNMCCRIYLGWKLMDYIHGIRPDVCRLTASINPFMTRGKF